MAEDVDALVEAVEENAVRTEAAVDRNTLEHRERFRIEHRDLWPAAREPMTRLGIDDGAVAARFHHRAHGIEIVEVVDHDPARPGGPRRCAVRRACPRRPTTRDVQTASDGV